MKKAPAHARAFNCPSLQNATMGNSGVCTCLCQGSTEPIMNAAIRRASRWKVKLDQNSIRFRVISDDSGRLTHCSIFAPSVIRHRDPRSSFTAKPVLTRCLLGWRVFFQDDPQFVRTEGVPRPGNQRSISAIQSEDGDHRRLSRSCGPAARSLSVTGPDT